MKNAAVNATTAIADGVSSLLGGSKVKRLEAENENLRQDIAYRPDRTQKEEVGKTGEEELPQEAERCSTATDAMTAIASGVGSLFGSGKLKELEQANGKLQGKIDKRDNQIRLLNEHIRMQEERHSTEKHCQQEIHRQELNMKMKKAVISNKGCGLQD